MWLRAVSLCQPCPALLLWLCEDLPMGDGGILYGRLHESYEARYERLPVGALTDDLTAVQVLVLFRLTTWASGAERAAPAQSDACYRDGECDGSCAL